ncbi:MAG: lipid-A-disaccharide synthase [Candidatus Aminicenantes bacterium]|nr:lipid-A-disaccharide synthase [Candidatus Aminicenantes bacterium]
MTHSILIVAGENSGEKCGASFIKEFRNNNPSTEFFGIGGHQMKEEGVSLLYSIQDLSHVGIFEILSHLPRLKRILSNIKHEVERRKPEAAVLIDSPDFNLRLVKSLKKLGIPVLYYISPTVWAWRKGRLKTIKKYVDKMLLIFPFEAKIYQQAGIPAEYVGHPLLERMNLSLSREEFYQKYNLSPDKKTICLLPGSRQSEINYHMPILTPAVQKIEEEWGIQHVLPLAENLDVEYLRSFLPPDQSRINILTEDRLEGMAYSDLILSSCGTANLEAALLGVPFIAYYRISPLTYSLGIPFVRTRTYSIVNILAGSKIIPELIQKRFTPDNIVNETRNILQSEQTRARMKEQFQKIRGSLGERKASQNAAKALGKLLFLNYS